MKSVSESMKEVESKKSYLQEQVDQLNEDCARLKAQGNHCIVQGCYVAFSCTAYFCIVKVITVLSAGM